MSARRHGTPRRATEVSLPITPMLDMSFQLLFFFIATFHLPTGMEGTLDLNLPSQPAPPISPSANVDPFDPSDAAPPDLRSEITVSVQTVTGNAGSDAIGFMTIEEMSGKTPLSPPYSKRLDELTARLKDRAATKGDTAPSVRIEGDSRLKWRSVVRVMDACRNAGLADVHFAPPPDYADYPH